MKAHVYWNLIKIFLIGSYSLYFTLPLELGTHREKIKKEMCLWFSHIEHKCSTPITVFKKGRCNWSGRFQLSPSCPFPNWLFLLPNPLSNKRSWSYLLLKRLIFIWALKSLISPSTFPAYSTAFAFPELCFWTSPTSPLQYVTYFQHTKYSILRLSINTQVSLLVPDC